MNPLRWGSQHDVFLPEIDAEHRAVFLAGEELHRALAGAAGPEKLAECWRNLLQLTEVHFRHEEQLMRDSGFESREWHGKQHDAVRKRAQKVDTAHPESVTGFLEYMGVWLRDHTSVADRIMASHIRNWTRRRAA